MERTQYDWQHQYLVTPPEYPISANENHSTYDQFIQLRDTLIFTWKYYNDKASRKLCVGDKGDWTTTNTIEVWLPNIFRQGFQPTWRTDENKPWILGNYITSPDWTVPQELLSQVWPLCCLVQKDWHYRIVHKEEVLLTPTTEKVFCYVDIYRKNAQWVWEIPYKWWIAVFDWQWAGSLSWTTSWTDPSGTCTVSFKLWQLIQKMTAFWYMERDLLKWDLLVLRMKDWPHDPSTWEPTGNDLTIQNDSNYWSIEYLDLPYNI
jgi:hypothetical protein